MGCNCIKQTSIPHATRLFTEFLYHFDRVRPFYSFDPFNRESFSRAAQALEYPARKRAAVAAALEEQAARFGTSEATRRNLERLRKGAAAVVTGQQVGLFTGPMFALYKALTAIRLADWLTADGLDCVPVFWLATDDHDLHEVNHAFLLDAGYQFHRLEDEAAPHVPNSPVGRVTLSSQISAQTERLVSLLPRTEWLPELAEALRDTYRPGVSFGDAFGRLLARLLARYGVLFLDPMHPQLRRLAAPVVARTLELGDQLRGAVTERNKELGRAGYHAQVHVTEQATFLFVNSEGRRTPLRRRNGEFALGDERLSKGGLLARLEQHPDDFSANVLLRPVVQDVLLPTVAYVGGPSELAYLAQASVLYHRLLGRMPVVYPRASFTLVDRAAAELLERYGLSLLDVLAGPQALRQKMAPHFLPAEMSAAFAAYETRLQGLLADLSDRMEKFDHTLADAAATAARKMTYQLAKIKRKAGRAAGLRSGELETDAALLENVLHPRKDLQERVYSGVSFLARFGPGLFDRLYERISTRSGDHQVVAVKGDE